jgi:hypothetical protein
MSNRNSLHERPPLPGQGHMENYTNAFFVSVFPLVFMVLCVLWVIIGYPLTLATAYVTDKLINRASRNA